MIIKVQRGKPVNQLVEIETDRVIHSEGVGTGGRLSFENGDMMALNGEEWRQWVEQNAEDEDVIDVKDLHKANKIEPVFVKAVRDRRGLYEKGKIC